MPRGSQSNLRLPGVNYVGARLPNCRRALRHALIEGSVKFEQVVPMQPINLLGVYISAWLLQRQRRKLPFMVREVLGSQSKNATAVDNIHSSIRQVSPLT